MQQRSASTVLACIGLVLGFCPLGLLVFGKRLRAHSRVATALRREAEEAAEKDRAKVAGAIRHERDERWVIEQSREVV